MNPNQIGWARIAVLTRVCSRAAVIALGAAIWSSGALAQSSPAGSPPPPQPDNSATPVEAIVKLACSPIGSGAPLALTISFTRNQLIANGGAPIAFQTGTQGYFAKAQGHNESTVRWSQGQTAFEYVQKVGAIYITQPNQKVDPAHPQYQCKSVQ